MIKILKPGYLKEVTCDKCGAVLQYNENEDVTIDDWTAENGVLYCPKKIYYMPSVL